MSLIWFILFLHLFSSLQPCQLQPYRATKFQGLINQEAAWDCGPAAAATLLTLAEQKVHPWPADSARTASLVDLCRYLQSHGWKVEGYFLDWEEIEFFFLHFPFRPLLAHCSLEEEGHYTVLLGLVQDWLVIADPANGVHAVASRDFMKAFSGYILYFPQLDALPSVEKLLNQAEQRLNLLQQAVH